MEKLRCDRCGISYSDTESINSAKNEAQAWAEMCRADGDEPRGLAPCPMLTEMVTRGRRNGGDLAEKEMWRAARCVRNRYRRAYGKRPLSLNSPIQGTEEPIELWETLPDKGCDLDAWLDARIRLGELPTGILRIARKLEKGDPLTWSQHVHLARFRQNGGPSPKQVQGRKYYRGRRSKGLCITCGEEADGSAHCPRCLERHRAYQKQYRRRKGKAWQRTLRKHWRKQGRCPRCGGVPDPGRKKCSSCLTKDRDHLRRWRGAKKGNSPLAGQVKAS